MLGALIDLTLLGVVAVLLVVGLGVLVHRRPALAVPVQTAMGGAMLVVAFLALLVTAAQK